MNLCRKAVLLILCGFVCVLPAAAQENLAGRDIVLGKCFQCHTDSMYRDLRQDSRGWEATIYRMIGRGGLWTPEEIGLMADYLGVMLGPNATPAAAPRR
jgi:mono/diheme cytochrome c family protein